MDNKCYKVFRITNDYGGIISCHIFSATTENKLNKKIKKQFIEWLWMGPEGHIPGDEEEKIKQKDEEKIIQLIDEELDKVDTEWHSEVIECISNNCEFVQKY